MPQINSILVLGKNERSRSIIDYLRELTYQVTSGHLTGKGDHIITDDGSSCDCSAFAKFDIVILAGASHIITADCLRLPTYGFLNCHAGSVPEYRGSSPMNWSIINKERIFGLSVIQTALGIDVGDIHAQGRFDLAVDACIADLHAIANANFPYLVHTALLNIENSIPPVKQVTTGVGYYPLRDRLDSRVDFAQMTSEDVFALFRSLVPLYPSPYFICDGREYKILQVKMDYITKGVPAKIYRIVEDSIQVSCAQGSVWLKLESVEGLSRYQLIRD